MLVAGSPDPLFLEATLEWLQDSLPVGLFATDRGLRVVMWNHWLEVHSGLTAEDVVGRSLLDVYPELRSRHVERDFESVLRGRTFRLPRRTHPYLLPMRCQGALSVHRMEQSCTISPLWRDGQIVGTIGTVVDVTHEVNTRAVLRHQVEELERVRLQLARKSEALERSLAHEHELVQTFASSFLQPRPDHEVLDIGCLYEPACSADHVGGDFFDFIHLDDHRLAVVIGDVCGKGIQAGVYTAMAKYTLRAYAAEDPNPASLMRRLNEALCRQMTDPDMFISLVYAVLNVKKEVVYWVNAGHPAPVLVDSQGQASYLEPTSMVLGAMPDLEVRHGTLPFGPGSVLAFVTDGVTEASGDSLATAECGLADLLLQDGEAEEMVGRIYGHALQQCGGPLRDDTAIVVARFRPQS